MTPAETVARVQREHDGLTVNLTTPRDFTRHGGWSLDCAGCGKLMGDQGDEDEAWENHRAHVAGEVVAALGLREEQALRGESRRYVTEWEVERRYVTGWQDVAE